jgi:hypothetical protein
MSFMVEYVAVRYGQIDLEYYTIATGSWNVWIYNQNYLHDKYIANVIN